MANIMRRQTPTSLPQRYREWDPFERMRELLNWEPFQDLARTGRTGGETVDIFAPAFDVREGKDAFIFKADLPGIREEDVDISVSGNRLTITGKREAEHVEDTDSYYCSERSYGTFTRSFTLPEGANADQIQADMQQGVLTLRVPKTTPAQPKKISLKAGKGGEKAKA